MLSALVVSGQGRRIGDDHPGGFEQNDPRIIELAADLVRRAAIAPGVAGASVGATVGGQRAAPVLHHAGPTLLFLAPAEGEYRETDEEK